MHSTSDYVSNESEFSSSKWKTTTEFYIDKIHNNLKGDNWTAIFQALHRLKESTAQGDWVQTGAPLVLKECEALLPADPPSPPPLE